MPGTQAQSVNKNTIKIEPQPLSMTAKGGKNIAKITLNNDIVVFFMFANIMIFIVVVYCIF
jgi:hypothetical protein